MKEQETQKNNIPYHISMESAIGSVLLIATKSQSYKYLFSHDYEWMIIPPIAAGQYSLFRNKRNEPIAFVSFASVNEEVEKRIIAGSLKLSPADWTSGDKLYIIDVISPFIPVIDILKELNDGQFKDKNIKILRPNENQKGKNNPIRLKEFLKTNPKDKSDKK